MKGKHYLAVACGFVIAELLKMILIPLGVSKYVFAGIGIAILVFLYFWEKGK